MKRCGDFRRRAARAASAVPAPALTPATVRVAILALALTLAPAAVPPAFGGGFSIFEQGSKAMGMGGAFTAQADDPSAMFHNVGGLAFLDQREFAAGFSLVASDGPKFRGTAPGIAAGAVEQMESFAVPLPHFYWVEPVAEGWTFGLAITTPYGLASEWDPDNFSGRFITTKAGIKLVDVSPNLGWKVSDRLGVGFGLLLRASEIELRRRLPVLNPASGTVVDAAQAVLKSEMELGVGWQAGLLFKANESFSWGLSYRSGIDVDYSGDGRLTQVPTGFPPLDALLAAMLPFDRDLPIKSSIAYPDMWSLGVAVALSPAWLVELDYNGAGWSSVQQIPVAFPTFPALDAVVRQNWKDVNNYRLGLRWTRGPKSEWRFGLYLDETPQPLETLGPILPDGDRVGYAVGYGSRGRKSKIDIALLYVPVETRTTRVNLNFFNGTWRSSATVLGATVGW